SYQFFHFGFMRVTQNIKLVVTNIKDVLFVLILQPLAFVEILGVLKSKAKSFTVLNDLIIRHHLIRVSKVHGAAFSDFCFILRVPPRESRLTGISSLLLS